MKKLICCALVMCFVLSAGSALGKSLFDMWKEYTWDTPGYGGKMTISEGSERIVEGHRVGPITDWMMEYIWIDQDNTIETSKMNLIMSFKNMILSWSMECEDQGMELPFFKALIKRIDDIQIKMLDSEFYEFYQNGEWDGGAELYLLNIAVDFPDGQEVYEVLVCLQSAPYTLSFADYYVLSGDLSKLGVEKRFALTTYCDEFVIYNCEEWVSLRAKPSTKAERLAKVPKYAKVYNCFDTDNGFTYCEYNGQTGFILREYLESEYYVELYG